MESFAGPAHPRRAGRRHRHPDRQRAGGRLSRPRPVREQGRARSPVRPRPGRVRSPRGSTGPTPYQSPWGGLFSVGGDSASAGYFLSDDQRLLFILAEPESKSGSFTADQRLDRGHPRRGRPAQGPVPQREGRRHRQADAVQRRDDRRVPRQPERATYLAFALTLGLLLLAFLRVGKPIVMLIVLTLSLCWSIGAATLVIGHLSLFSVMFISIVIGIGIDYGIYFLFRYEEELFLGRNLREAIEITAARTGPGMLLERRHRGRHVLRADAHGFPRRAGARLHRRDRHPAGVGGDDDGVPGHAGPDGPPPRRSAARHHAARAGAGVHPRTVRRAADLLPQDGA